MSEHAPATAPEHTETAVAEGPVWLVVVHEEDDELVALERALADAQVAGAQLAVVAIHDPAAEHELTRQLAQCSFLGARASDSVAAVACRSLEDRQRELLVHAERRVEQVLGRRPPSRLVRGPMVQALLPISTELRASRVYVRRIASPPWRRLFRASPEDTIARAIPLPVVFV